MNRARDEERLRWTDPELVDCYFKIAPVFEQVFPGSYLTIPATGGYRTLEGQSDAHLGGASGYDGRHSFSKHQFFPAHALDWAVIEGDSLVDDGMDPRYEWVGREFEKSGFRWGGNFRHRKDWDHAEILGPDPTRREMLDGLQAHLKKEADTQTS